MRNSVRFLYEVFLFLMRFHPKNSCLCPNPHEVLSNLRERNPKPHEVLRNLMSFGDVFSYEDFFHMRILDLVILRNDFANEILMPYFKHFKLNVYR